MTSIFVDTNIPIYASGREHPLKSPCRAILTLIAEEPQSFFTDAEVFQEILHRYLAIRRWAQGKAVFAEFVTLMRARIRPIRIGDVERAALLAEQYHGLNARDLLHLAVLEQSGATAILSADRGFDMVPHVERLDPAAVGKWRQRIAE